MRLALLLALAACSSREPIPDPDPAALDCQCDAASCPLTPPDDGSACGALPVCEYPLDTGATVCNCTELGWTCFTSTCPADLEATCTPGAACSTEDWEHGCSCRCGDDARWRCTPETIGSQCETGPDAGPI